MKKYLLLFFKLLLVFNAYSFSYNSNQPKVDYTEWNLLLKRFVDMKGKVNYFDLKENSSLLQTTLDTFSEVRIDNSWSTNDKIAFWINVYNAYTLKLIIDHYPVKSIKEINAPWKTKFFEVNGQKLSLGDVEHKILRKMGDPRIHFAINCASNSCPRIIQVAYTGENIDRLLNRQTKEHLNNPMYNEVTAKSYELTKLFSWFAKDFKNEEVSTIKEFVNLYSDIKIKDQINKGYKKYDWDLNRQK